MCIGDWSSDFCSSDLAVPAGLSDEAAMRLALQQAGLAYAAGEVPVGAVALNAQGQVIGLGFNRSIVDHDPSSHAELVTLRQAAAFMKNYRLPGVSLFVPLQPSAMCLGAMSHARLARVVYGATRAADRRVGKGGVSQGNLR